MMINGGVKKNKKLTLYFTKSTYFNFDHRCNNNNRKRIANNNLKCMKIKFFLYIFNNGSNQLEDKQKKKTKQKVVI